MNKSSSHFAPLILRIIIGISFILHGYSKVMNLAGTSQFFEKIGIPLSNITAPFVGYLELFGGIALVLGLWTDLFASLLFIDMILAILTAKLNKGWVGGFELELLLLVGSLSLVLSGPGAFSISKGWIFSKKTKLS